jgi:hypothetical protein
MKTGWAQRLFSNTGDYNQLASFTADVSLLAGSNEQPVLPPLFFDGLDAVGKTLRIEASGYVGSNATPTYIFQGRLGTTAGSAYLSGKSVGVTAAITTGNTILNKMWRLTLDMICLAPGLGTNLCTLLCQGKVESEGFASPFSAPLEPTTPDTQTWTQTIDGSLMQFFNLSATCSASDALNIIRCKKLLAWVLD